MKSPHTVTFAIFVAVAGVYIPFLIYPKAIALLEISTEH